MGKYKLTYFGVRGRGETCRIVLVAGGFDWEDNRISLQQLAEVKPKSPFGQIPFLEFDGHVLGQSAAIVRYLGREAGFCGDNSFETFQIDAIFDQVTDAREKYVTVIFAPEDKKATLQQDFTDKYLPEFFTKLEKVFQDNKSKSGYFVGTKMTIADLHYYATINGLILTYAEKGLPALTLDAYPGLKSCYEKVASNEKIKAYVDARPEGRI